MMTTTKKICDPTDAPPGHIAIPSLDCTGCAFDDGEKCVIGNGASCLQNTRKDGVSVIFQSSTVNTYKADKSAAAQALNAMRNSAMSPAQRLSIARTANVARWDCSTPARTPKPKSAKKRGKSKLKGTLKK